ncbi:hypothetical protein M5689_012179 [Euphorbia peplus]|nr:hypothetical protein M5689_012179 [Euphorbia peplus]
MIQTLPEHSEHGVDGLAFSHDRKFLGSISDDHLLKLWDLDESLQEPKNTQNGENADSDNDSDEMEVEVNPPKFRIVELILHFFGGASEHMGQVIALQITFLQTCKDGGIIY